MITGVDVQTTDVRKKEEEKESYRAQRVGSLYRAASEQIHRTRDGGGTNATLIGHWAFGVMLHASRS